MKNRPRHHAYLGFTALLLLAACGKLSKSDAHDIIQSTYYDKDDNAYCSWLPEDRHKNDPTKDAKVLEFVSTDSEACVTELAAAGVLKAKAPPQPWYGGGKVYSYALVGSAYYAKDGTLQVPCGKKKLGDVSSVSTEGNKATVKYARTFTVDTALLGKLEDCTFTDKPKPGESDETMKFRRDDDGKWAPDY